MNKERKLLLAATVAMVGVSTALADVFDDALIWWRGAYDENQDGLMSASEFYNHKFPKTDTEHQNGFAKFSGNSTVSITNCNVASVWCAKTNNIPVMRFNQDGSSSTILTLDPAKTGATGAVTEMTYYFRFKWDGNKNGAVLFDSVTWYWCRGVALVLNQNGESTLKVGRKSYTITAFKLEPNRWYDLFLYTKDTGSYEGGCTSRSDHNVSMEIEVISAQSYMYYYWPGAKTSNPGSTWVEPDKKDTSWCCRTTVLNINNNKGCASDSIRIGENFRGEIAQIGYWPRSLTDDEKIRVSNSPVMGPALLTVGKRDGKGDEFAKDLSTATNSVTLPGTWDCIPAKLNEDFNDVSFRFYETKTAVHDQNSTSTNIAYYTTFSHVLVVKAAATCGECAVDVRIDKGTKNERKLGKRIFKAGAAEFFYLPTLSGNAWHTLDLKRISGTFELDYAQIFGAWCLGDLIYDYWEDNINQYKGNTAPYPIEWNTPLQKMSTGLTLATDEWTENRTCTISMDLTEEFAKLGYKYRAATGYSKDTKRAYVIVYTNGVEFCKTSTPYQIGSIGTITFPAGSFSPGRNTISMRLDPDYHDSSFWVNVRGHVFTPVESTLPEPTNYNAPMHILLK